MALTDKALTTVALVEAELGLSSGADSRIEGWIEDASEMIADYLGRVLERATVTDEKHHANGGHYLLLKRTPIVSVTSITFDDVALAAEDYVIDNADSGELYFPSGLAHAGDVVEGVSALRRDGSGERLYEVTYVAGWYTAGQVRVGGTHAGQTENTPRSLRRACIEMVAFLRSSAARDHSVKSEAMPGYSVTYGDVDDNGIPAAVRKKLDPFKMPVML